MLRKIISSGIAVSALNMAFAQDSLTKPTLTVSGSADVYYKYDFGKSPLNNFTSFTHSHNSFEPGMATVKFNYKTPKVELVTDLGFGKRAKEFSYTDDGISAAIKQLYISYSPANWVKLTAGSWSTHVGYEVLDAYLNRNYSMSYMFTNGPFSHTGVKLEASHGAHGLMVGIANPTDYKYVPEGFINKKAFIAQYSFIPGDFFKAYFNYVNSENIDTTKSKQYDVVLISKFSDHFNLALNGTYNNTSVYLGNKEYDKNKNWWGSAIYLNYDASSHFGLTLREEYFSDKDGLKVFSASPIGGSIIASTLSANFKLDNFTFIPEFRMDRASEFVFVDSHNIPTKTATNFLLAAIYQF